MSVVFNPSAGQPLSIVQWRDVGAVAFHQRTHQVMIYLAKILKRVDT